MTLYFLTFPLLRFRTKIIEKKMYKNMKKKIKKKKKEMINSKLL